jgi:hypothetical protein
MIRKVFVLIIICSVSLDVSGQQTHLKQDETDEYYQEYSVLQSNKKIKHGPYTKLTKTQYLNILNLNESGQFSMGKKNGQWHHYFKNPPNQIKEIGSYKDDLKDSLWTTYYSENKNTSIKFNDLTQTLEVQNINTLIRSLEYYKDGKSVGIWRLFDTNQTLIQEYNFDTDSLIFDASIPDATSDHEAIFIGKDIRMMNVISDNFDFINLMNGIHNKVHLQTGHIILKFMIDPDGNISNVQVIEDTIANKKVLDKISVAITSLSGEWIPKRVNGKKISSTKSIKLSMNQDVHRNYNRRTISIGYHLEMVDP